MNAKQLQHIPVLSSRQDRRRASAFTDGHMDGLTDAVNGNTSAPRARFNRWHAHYRPESDFAEYERAYTRSYDEGKKYMESAC